MTVSLDRFQQRLLHEELMAGSIPIPKRRVGDTYSRRDWLQAAEPNLEEAAADVHQSIDQTSACMQMLLKKIQQLKQDAQTADARANLLAARLESVATILRDFHGASLSMSSVAPVLELAETLNPLLRGTR